MCVIHIHVAVVPIDATEHDTVKLSIMSRALTLKQRRFADEYLENGGNGSKAAAKVYNVSTELSARAMASQNLAADKVMAYIQARAADAAIHMKNLAFNAKNETVQYNATRDILDRAGYKPVERTATITEHRYTGSVQLTHLAERIASELGTTKMLDEPNDDAEKPSV